MSRFLYAWELGANLGHVGRFEPVAQQLKHSGHDITFAVRDTDACALLLGDRFAWLQAPVKEPKPGTLDPINYADILLAMGYDDPVTLWGLVVAWRNMLQLVRPDLVFADHAPTAILAARTLGIPVMLCSDGFAVPPACTPLPAMRHWEPVNDQLLAVRDAKALSAINTVLTKVACKNLLHLSDLFDVAENALFTLPELDHYQGRQNGRYWGLLPSMAIAPASTITWPTGRGARLFAYVRHDPEVSASIIAAIAESGCPSIVYYPNWAGQMPLPSTMTILTTPADLSEMAAQAHIGVVYAPGTVSAFLKAGKPVLCIVSHLEQFLFAVRVSQMGAGIVVRADTERAHIKTALNQLLSHSSFSAQAQSFAAKYASLDPATVMTNVCARALDLAEGSNS